jgi:hypothetical protein
LASIGCARMAKSSCLGLKVIRSAYFIRDSLPAGRAFLQPGFRRWRFGRVCRPGDFNSWKLEKFAPKSPRSDSGDSDFGF